MWLQYDLSNRMEYAEELFKLITVNLCSNKIMLDNIDIDTGNIELDEIIKDININITVRDCINKNNDSLNLLNKYGSKSTFYNIKYNKYSLYNVCKDGIYILPTKNAFIKYDLYSVNNVIYTKYNVLYILCCRKGKMFKYDKLTNILTKCNYPSDYLFNDNFPPTINEMCDGNLITIGGTYIDTRVITNKVMIYNTSKDTWSAGPTLPYVVSNHATVIDNRVIYVISGYSNKCITTVIRYKDNVWETIAPLEYTRERHIAVKSGNLIYAIAGLNSDHTITTNIESYNIHTNQWNTINTSVFNGINKDNTVYDNNSRLFYKYEDSNIYCISLDNYTKIFKYSNIKKYDDYKYKFILM